MFGPSPYHFVFWFACVDDAGTNSQIPIEADCLYDALKVWEAIRDDYMKAGNYIRFHSVEMETKPGASAN